MTQVVVVLKRKWTFDVGVMAKEELCEKVVEIRRVNNKVMADVLAFEENALKKNSPI